MCSFVYGQRADYEGIITFDERNIRQLTAADWTDIVSDTLASCSKNYASSRTDCP